MKTIKTKLEGVLVVQPRVFADARGFFLETYQQLNYSKIGIESEFVQDNHSRSSKGVLRGLHLQVKQPQGKLIRAVTGRIWDVAVDVNPKSKTFRQWVGFELSDQNHHQLYIPPGYAHGFVVLSESADLAYKCTDFYSPLDEVGIRWDDSELAIEWPVKRPIVSERDDGNLSLTDYVELDSR